MILCLLVGLVAFAGCDGRTATDSPLDVAPATQTTEPEAEPVVETEAAEEATIAILPDVVGRSGDEARDILEEWGFEEIDFVDAVEDRTVWAASDWIVLEQSPEPGASTLTSTTITLSVRKQSDAPSPEATTPEATTPPPTAETSPTPEEPSSVPVAGVIDGDTIDVTINGERVRIRVIGIDTPEINECGYQPAASAMQSLVQSQEVRLEADATQADADVHGRLLRHVFTMDGKNVAEEIIRQGLGVEYTYDLPYRYVDAFVAAQEAARSAGLGLWGTMCEPTPAPVPLVETEPEECLIKGNINGEGEKIYHMPNQRYYEKTKISEGKGERWFCTPEEAEEAGWRRAKV